MRSSRERPVSNTPIHSPLYSPDLKYGSDDAEILGILVEVEEAKIRALLNNTPFEFVSPHAWLDVSVFRTSFGIDPFGNGGITIPAEYKGNIGSYYAFCYVDTDESLALGREPWGYPKKYAAIHLQKTGNVVTAAVRRKDAWFEISAALDEVPRELPPVARSPYLLLQVLPSAESPEVLLKRVISRDTNSAARMTTQTGVGAFTIQGASTGNDLMWLADAKPIYAFYSRGVFRGVYGTVLGTEEIGKELCNAIGKTSV